MSHAIRRNVALGVAGVAIAAGGGLAYATTKESPADQRKAFLDDAAKRLNVSPSDLGAALQGAFGDRLDEAVKNGTLTKAQADRIKQRLKDGGGLPLFGGRGPGGPGVGPSGPGGGPGFGPHGPGPGPGFGRGPFRVLDAAAKYLDLSQAKLRDALAAGKSLADVAKDQGKDVDGLKTALTDAAKADLDKAVADKRLTQEQEDRMLKELDSHIGDLVDAVRPERGLRRGFRHRR